VKARGRLVVLCALAALLALPASALAAAGKPSELKIGSFELEGSNGYAVEVSSVREGDSTPIAVVNVQQDPLQAIYQVRARPGVGTHATFGSLGQLDVSFERRSKEVERPEPGCAWITERGVFRGSFRFTGENGYFTSEAVDPSGEMLRLPNGFCGFPDDRAARPGDPRLHQTVLTAQAATAKGSVSFHASRWSFDRMTTFSAELNERVGAMKIRRTAEAPTLKRTRFSAKSSRASVAPPPPFRGSARFRDPAKGPPRWTGSLSVSFPGAPNTALAGKGFSAKLCPRLPVLAKCR
jgi:hypothetical protein